MYFVGTVRVTLVQTPLGSGGKAIVSQPSSISTVSGTTQQVYKPVTITTQQPGQTTLGIGSAGGIRTGINATTLVPTPLSVGMLESFSIQVFYTKYMWDKLNFIEDLYSFFHEIRIIKLLRSQCNN